MKKIILLTCLLGTTTTFLFAQTVKFGLKGGANFASEYASYQNSSATSDTHVDFHLGVVADVAFNSLSVQPGLLYTVKGMTGGRLSYLEVPVNVLYNTGAGNGKFFFGGGPYLAYGVSASNGITFGSSANDFASLDYGLGLLAGYRANNGVFLSAGYEFGLANLINSSAGLSGLGLKNRAATISVGYFF